MHPAFGCPVLGGIPHPTSQLTCAVRTELGSFRAALSSSAEETAALVKKVPPNAPPTLPGHGVCSQ